jgi:hypothetical protein
MIFSENSGRLTPSLAAVARHPLLGVACSVSIDQYTCITEKRYAVLTPNSSIPSTASSAPIICQGRCSVSPDAPRLSSMKGFQSYVELLTCLQTTQDAKKLPTQQ